MVGRSLEVPGSMEPAVSRTCPSPRVDDPIEFRVEASSRRPAFSPAGGGILRRDRQHIRCTPDPSLRLNCGSAQDDARL